MRKDANTRRLVTALCVLTGCLLVVATSADSKPLYIYKVWPAPLSTVDDEMNAHLSGGDEVPAVTTDASGTAVFRLSGDGTQLSYRLSVTKIEGVFQAHIHEGSAGRNGPLVAFLLEPVPGGTGPVDGVLAEGSITAADLVGPLAGATLTDLANEISAGDMYVHVHTLPHPSGEIRGQIR